MKNVRNLKTALENFKEAAYEVLNQVENCSKKELDIFEYVYNFQHSFDEVVADISNMSERYNEEVYKSKETFYVLCIEDGQYFEKNWVYQVIRTLGENVVEVHEEFLPGQPIVCGINILNKKTVKLPKSAYDLILTLNENGDDTSIIIEALKSTYKDSKID